MNFPEPIRDRRKCERRHLSPTSQTYNVEWRRPNDPEVLRCAELTPETLVFRIRAAIKLCGSVELLALTSSGQTVTPSVRELLELSTLYHQLISDLGDIFDVNITGTQRSRAFQVVSDFVEQLEARK